MRDSHIQYRPTSRAFTCTRTLSLALQDLSVFDLWQSLHKLAVSYRIADPYRPTYQGVYHIAGVAREAPGRFANL